MTSIECVFHISGLSGNGASSDQDHVIRVPISDSDSATPDSIDVVRSVAGQLLQAQSLCNAFLTELMDKAPSNSKHPNSSSSSVLSHGSLDSLSGNGDSDGSDANEYTSPSQHQHDPQHEKQHSLLQVDPADPSHNIALKKPKYV
ncbi:hypothetical protein BASA50_001682 [Batrachochytrium salamandrivorans]|uniref:EKC/KEOPS complex subunit GON7 n=1 Tax=Batrachochytrium salamandrivorans TaxID=1357716 RepID=A0ABQ8FNF6_9FUNG|nr:hypothetical protein BASA60_006681 [Batrachochytrium salamandrivorans]KAH6601332.1 hypothetical protein BASA50_001682 [Batrachochytrium salamandrivorans]